MSSPIGHALAAAAAGLMLAPPAAGRRGNDDSSKPPDVRGSLDWRTRRWLRLGAGLGLVGVLPDLDLLFGTHSASTHSIGAVALAFAATVLVAPPPRLRVALAVAAAYCSHLVLDWASEDSSVPIGIMALWPFSDVYYHAGFDVFFATDRRYWLDGFLWRNLRSIAWELLLLVPLVVGVWRLRAAPSKVPSAARSRRSAQGGRRSGD